LESVRRRSSRLPDQSSVRQLFPAWVLFHRGARPRRFDGGLRNARDRTRLLLAAEYRPAEVLERKVDHDGILGIECRIDGNDSAAARAHWRHAGNRQLREGLLVGAVA